MNLPLERDLREAAYEAQRGCFMPHRTEWGSDTLGPYKVAEPGTPLDPMGNSQSLRTLLPLCNCTLLRKASSQ